MNTCCVFVFTKYPEKNDIKTRLDAELKKIDIVTLYKNFVVDLLDTLDELKIKYDICIHPSNSKEKFINWLGDKYLYYPQEGHDLGDKMKNCFIKAFSKNIKRAIIIGSDSPDLPGEFIIDAALSLKTHDAVIGPANDGGYYLIGFNADAFTPEIFQEIPWSTNKVFKETIDILNRANINTCILPEWTDIDVYSDLIEYIRRNKKTKFNQSNTYSYLLRVCEEINRTN